MRVLVTGAAGSIGRVLAVGLTDLGHEVVGLDLVPPPEGDDRPWYVVDCTDPDAVRAVFAEERLDAVVHLAGNPGEGSLPESLTSHVVTTAALLDAAVAHDVRRFVYASSNHAVGRTPRSDVVTIETRPRPDTFYGVGKVAAEALLSLYVDRYGMDALACRIGSFRARAGVHAAAVHLALARRLRADDRRLPHHAGARLRGALRHLRQHPGLVGPRARPGARLPADGRRRGVRRPDPGGGRRRRRGRPRGRAVHVGDVLPPRAGSRRLPEPGDAAEHHPVVVPAQQRAGDVRRQRERAGDLHMLLEVHPGAAGVRRSPSAPVPSRSPDTSTSSTVPSRETACSTRSRV